MSDKGWRLIFETEREILKRRLDGWLCRRSDPSGVPDRIAQERLRESLQPPRRRRLRLGAVVGWPISILLHLLLVALALPHIFPDPPVEEPDPPIRIRFVTLERPAPAEVEAPPAEIPAPVPPPDPLPTVPVPDPPTEDPIEEVLETPDAVPADAPESEDPPAPTADAASPLGLGPGAQRRGRSALGARYGERVEALRIYGGGAETEAVVRRGLEWLARHQDPDGSWDPHGYTRHCRPGVSCPGTGFPEYRTGVTGLALLAFLGAGIDHRDPGPFRQTVAGAIEWLVVSQDEGGCFGPRDGQFLYNHGIAALAMAEAAALTRDPELLASCARAVRFIEATQQSGGGWDYTGARTNRNDLSVSGWQVMALHSAVEAGVVVSPRTLNRLEAYLRRAVRGDGSAIYADRGTGAGRGGIGVAAIGLLSKLYLGWSPRSPESQRAAVRLVRQGPDPDGRADWERTYQSLYYWYTATLALFHIGGEPWEAWNLFLQRKVISLQHDEGEREGSFDPDPNWIGAAGGRITSTALGVLTFEVYYRYTPLYRKLGLAPSSKGGEASDR